MNVCSKRLQSHAKDAAKHFNGRAARLRIRHALVVVVSISVLAFSVSLILRLSLVLATRRAATDCQYLFCVDKRNNHSICCH